MVQGGDFDAEEKTREACNGKRKEPQSSTSASTSTSIVRCGHVAGVSKLVFGRTVPLDRKPTIVAGLLDRLGVD